MKDVLRLVREQKFSFSTLYIILTKNRYTNYCINAFIIARQKFLGSFKYDHNKYADTFLVNTATSLQTATTAKLHKVIYCFWIGDNEMSENLKNAIKSLQDTSGVPVKIVTQHNLADYIVPGYPLHEAYDHLSFVHKSDYLRCYFMLHYGGGYSDVLKTALAQNPGNDRGTNKGYPVPWTYILGDIFHPLCLKYHKSIIHDNRIKPDMTNYK